MSLYVAITIVYNAQCLSSFCYAHLSINQSHVILIIEEACECDISLQMEKFEFKQMEILK